MDDKTAVEQADNGFFAALNAMFGGDLAPMNALWSHADDVIYMGPDAAIHVGWPATSASWKDQAAMKLGGEIHAVERHTTVGGDLAVVYVRADGSNTTPDGAKATFSLRGTNVFRKEGGAWKLIAHHSDPLPYLQD